MLGGRELPPRFLGVISLLAPALLAALVVTATLADGQELAVGEHTVGVAAGGVVAWRTGSIIGCVVVAAVRHARACAPCDPNRQGHPNGSSMAVELQIAHPGPGSPSSAPA